METEKYGHVDQCASQVHPETSPTPRLVVESKMPEWIASYPRRLVFPQIDRSRELVHAPARESFMKCAKSGKGWPLFFYGLQGRGKTMAALWFLDHVIKPCYVTGRELVDYEFCSDWRRKDDFRNDWKKASLCVIDQFGMTGKQGPSQTQVIVDYLDKRTNRPLIVVSNLSPGEIDEVFDAQVRSRIEYGTKVEFRNLPDYRILASKSRA